MSVRSILRIYFILFLFNNTRTNRAFLDAIRPDDLNKVRLGQLMNWGTCLSFSNPNRANSSIPVKMLVPGTILGLNVIGLGAGKYPRLNSPEDCIEHRNQCQFLLDGLLF